MSSERIETRVEISTIFVSFSHLFCSEGRPWDDSPLKPHLEMIVGGVLLRQRQHLAIRILHEHQGKVILWRFGVTIVPAELENGVSLWLIRVGKCVITPVITEGSLLILLISVTCD